MMTLGLFVAFSNTFSFLGSPFELQQPCILRLPGHFFGKKGALYGFKIWFVEKISLLTSRLL